MSVPFKNYLICHVVCHINMSDLMMNVQTCVTDNTYYTMLDVKSVCLNKL